MAQKNKNSGRYRTVLKLIIVPMTFLALIVSGVAVRQSVTLTNEEVRESLSNVSSVVLGSYDLVDPGEFYLQETSQGNVLLKGNAVINGNYQIVDSIKEQTGKEISIIYYDTCILTTIRDGQGERMDGSGMNAVILRDVYEKNTSAFYTDLKMNETGWYAYYAPIRSISGKAIGMVGVLKPADQIHEKILKQTIPLILLMLLSIFAMGYIMYRWEQRVNRSLAGIEQYLKDMSEGRLSGELDPDILRRGDAYGEMARAVQRMQHDFRDLIQRDPLTGLYNRRFGNTRLQEIQKRSEKTGMPFSLAIGDIDFFKRINDTYGHECGDLILKHMAEILKKHLMGKGFAVRWGGEEVLVIYEQLSKEEAAAYLEQFMEVIRTTSVIYHDEEVGFKMTFGLASGNQTLGVDELIKKADARLYYGKEHGRDQLVTTGPV